MRGEGGRVWQRNLCQLELCYFPKNHNKEKFSSKYESSEGYKSQTLDRVKSGEDDQTQGGTISGFFARLGQSAMKASPKVTRPEAGNQPEVYKRKLRQRNKK